MQCLRTKMTKRKKESEKKTPGRKSLYKDEYVKQALKLSLLGATDKEMSDFFDVSEQAFNGWKKKYPELLESIKKGKQIADANVASSLYNRAMGFSKNDCEKVFCSNGGIIRAQVSEYYPPDVTAAIFWLKNRKAAMWRDKKESEISGNIEIGRPLTKKDINRIKSELEENF